MLNKISFQQIEYFLTMAEYLNFTDAAKILYISQPALSKQISVLENELGMSLFIRDRRHVALTPEGASLYRDWSELSKMMEHSVYNAKLISNEKSGQLSIGCTDSFDYGSMLPPAVNAFSQNYPEIDLTIESHSFKTLREGLMEDKFDIIFTPYFELDGIPDVYWIKLNDIPLSIVVPVTNPLSSKDSVSVADLKNESFILISPKDSVGGSEHTISLCRRCGFNLKNVRYVPNISSLELAVKNGLGVAVCNDRRFISSNDTCRIYPLDIPQEDSFLVGVWRKNRKSIPLDLFTKILQDQFHEPIR